MMASEAESAPRPHRGQPSLIESLALAVRGRKRKARPQHKRLTTKWELGHNVIEIPFGATHYSPRGRFPDAESDCPSELLAHIQRSDYAEIVGSLNSLAIQCGLSPYGYYVRRSSWRRHGARRSSTEACPAWWTRAVAYVCFGAAMGLGLAGAFSPSGGVSLVCGDAPQSSGCEDMLRTEHLWAAAGVVLAVGIAIVWGRRAVERCVRRKGGAHRMADIDAETGTETSASGVEDEEAAAEEEDAIELQPTDPSVALQRRLLQMAPLLARHGLRLELHLVNKAPPHHHHQQQQQAQANRRNSLASGAATASSSDCGSTATHSSGGAVGKGGNGDGTRLLATTTTRDNASQQQRRGSVTGNTSGDLSPSSSQAIGWSLFFILPFSEEQAVSAYCSQTMVGHPRVIPTRIAPHFLRPDYDGDTGDNHEAEAAVAVGNGSSSGGGADNCGGGGGHGGSGLTIAAARPLTSQASFSGGNRSSGSKGCDASWTPYSYAGVDVARPGLLMLSSCSSPDLLVAAAMQGVATTTTTTGLRPRLPRHGTAAAAASSASASTGSASASAAASTTEAWCGQGGGGGIYRSWGSDGSLSRSSSNGFFGSSRLSLHQQLQSPSAPDATYCVGDLDADAEAVEVAAAANVKSAGESTAAALATSPPPPPSVLRLASSSHSFSVSALASTPVVMAKGSHHLTTSATNSTGRGGSVGGVGAIAASALVSARPVPSNAGSFHGGSIVSTTGAAPPPPHELPEERGSSFRRLQSDSRDSAPGPAAQQCDPILSESMTTFSGQLPLLIAAATGTSTKSLSADVTRCVSSGDHDDQQQKEQQQWLLQLNVVPAVAASPACAQPV